MVSGNHPAIRPTEVVHVVTSKGIQRIKGKHEIIVEAQRINQWWKGLVT
jgi:hypothetical protein